MPPPQAGSVVSDGWIEPDQYTSVQPLHPELQSYSYDVVLGAGFSYPLPLPSAVNNPFLSPAKVSGQFTTLTTVNDQFNPNVYEPLQASFVLPSSYVLEETDFLAPSTEVDQSGGSLLPMYNVFNSAPTPYLPLLSPSTSVGMTIDALTEVSIAPPRPASVSERSNESPPNLHGPIQSPEPNTCQECTQSFPSNGELERHAKSLHHNAFECKCGKPYARLDNLKRHWNETPKFPCPHCNKYTGANAFAREDHLTQHLRSYHRINNSGDENDTTKQILCNWPNCTHSFGIKSQYTGHIRRIHNHSPFPCPVPGCVRVGGKGYFRESDLLKHSNEVHFVQN